MAWLDHLAGFAHAQHTGGTANPDTCLTMTAVSVFVGAKPIIADLSIHVRRGEAVGLLGRDGAGKTSCFEALAGLVAVRSGRIQLIGVDVTDQSADRRARLGLTYLSADVSIFRNLSVEANIAMALEACDLDGDAATSRLDRLLDDLRLIHLRHQLASTLSGGERRRCEIARALASEPAFMLLDEPFKGLDPMSIAEIHEIIGGLKARNVGVLVSDNNLHDLSDLLDRAYVLDHGHLIFTGSVHELLSDERVQHLYLGESFSL